MNDQPHKRAAFEPAERLLRPPPRDPGMKRPATTVAGAVLVLLRAVAGGFALLELSLHWPSGLGLLARTMTPDELKSGFAVIAVAYSIVLLADVVLAVLILLGRNGPRMIVMAIAVISISSSFVAWWARDQEITLKWSLWSLALDILVLLALSSRSAAAYARRNEMR